VISGMTGCSGSAALNEGDEDENAGHDAVAHPLAGGGARRGRDRGRGWLPISCWTYHDLSPTYHRPIRHLSSAEIGAKAVRDRRLGAQEGRPITKKETHGSASPYSVQARQRRTVLLESYGDHTQYRRMSR
jgi:hypothetical protein